MTKEFEALRVAAHLDTAPYSCYCTERAANELRRLHEENQEMLEALKAIIEDIDSEHGTDYEYAKARAVVDKGEQK